MHEYNNTRKIKVTHLFKISKKQLKLDNIVKYIYRQLKNDIILISEAEIIYHYYYNIFNKKDKNIYNHQVSRIIQDDSIIVKEAKNINDRTYHLNESEIKKMIIFKDKMIEKYNIKDPLDINYYARFVKIDTDDEAESRFELFYNYFVNNNIKDVDPYKHKYISKRFIFYLGNNDNNIPVVLIKFSNFKPSELYYN